MADALKIFEENEVIFAEDTNENNQFLLNTSRTLVEQLRTEIQRAISGAFLPAGVIMIMPSDNIPAGWMKCDGSSLLRADYEDLFKAISTLYGAADDYHFNLPDFRGRFLRGYGGNSASIGIAQGSAVPNITATFRAMNFSASGAVSLSGPNTDNFSGGEQLHARVASFAASRVSSVYQNVNEVRTDNYAVHWIIKY